LYEYEYKYEYKYEYEYKREYKYEWKIKRKGEERNGMEWKLNQSHTAYIYFTVTL